MRDSRPPEPGTVYVGGLPEDILESDLRRVFGRFGWIQRVWIARRPPGFGFVYFERIDDARLAVFKLHGERIWGVQLTVELSYSRMRPRNLELTPTRRTPDRSPQPRRHRFSRSRSSTPITMLPSHSISKTDKEAHYRKSPYERSRSRSPIV
uniref:RRM domain-containing protein n=1 Tax=Panagrellus redivivus TaxID=6233 RepID=A0A7E4UY49_PANRE